jgi:hypothetical protein
MAISPTYNAVLALSWEDLVEKIYKKITNKIQAENPGLLINIFFFETMKFLSHTPSSRKLAERWLQVRPYTDFLITINTNVINSQKRIENASRKNIE